MQRVLASPQAPVRGGGRPMISARRIARRVREMGQETSEVYADLDQPLVLIVILTGSAAPAGASPSASWSATPGTTPACTARCPASTVWAEDARVGRPPLPESPARGSRVRLRRLPSGLDRGLAISGRGTQTPGRSPR